MYESLLTRGGTLDDILTRGRGPWYAKGKVYIVSVSDFIKLYDYPVIFKIPGKAPWYRWVSEDSRNIFVEEIMADTTLNEKIFSVVYINLDKEFNVDL